TDRRHGPPLDADFRVLGLFDGKFSEATPRHGGYTQFDQGETALVSTANGLVVMLTSRRMVPFSLSQLTTFGVQPEQFRILVAKGVHAPVAAYAPVCKHLVRVDTPGCTCADMTKLTYRRRRRPLFPFETEAVYHS
ncbi:MAG: MlrC C-terminal domain-containing protein, partial [Gemmataceae bacterium]|nr:MlrC C-terminal domain-containing protein [Gemmataceae bacterium]